MYKLCKGGLVTTDLTEVFAEGVRSAEGYSHFALVEKMNLLEGISCDLDDYGANWDAVWTNKGGKTAVLAFFSRYYPAALVCAACPESVIRTLRENGVATAPLDSEFSCDEELLRKYAPRKNILDDSFLTEEDFSPDDERLFFIYERIRYITPRGFTFDEIR